MTLFRYRKWGSADWTEISISSDADDEIEDNIEDTIREILRLSELHAQEMSVPEFSGERPKWEDLQ